MKIKVELTVNVDPEEWAETYGTESDSATIRASVRTWVANAVSNHPDGLLANDVSTLDRLVVNS